MPTIQVFEAMEKLNYQPNEIARSLLKKQSNLIGLIVPNVSHPFFGEFTAHLEFYAYQHGFKLLVCNSQFDPVKEKEYIQMMKKNRVDGIIMGSHTLEVEEYKALHHPVVTIDRKIGSVPFISSENRMGGRLATKLLVDKGCRKVAHLCGNLALDMLSNERTEGYREVIRENGLSQVIVQTDLNVFLYPQYEQIIHKLLREHSNVDGIFATSDIIASYVVKVARSLGLSIPERLKVVGYDDIQLASWLTPAVTTIRQPIEEMAKCAIDSIISQINGEPIPMNHVFPVKLVERETT
jgi:LacI family sucrose operon transcriptional repressor